MTLQELGFKDGGYYLIEYLNWSHLAVSLIFTSSPPNFEAYAIVDSSPPKLSSVTEGDLVQYIKTMGKGSSKYLEFSLTHQQYQCLVTSWNNQK